MYLLLIFYMFICLIYGFFILYFQLLFSSVFDTVENKVFKAILYTRKSYKFQNYCSRYIVARTKFYLHNRYSIKVACGWIRMAVMSNRCRSANCVSASSYDKSRFNPFLSVFSCKLFAVRRKIDPPIFSDE